MDDIAQIRIIILWLALLTILIVNLYGFYDAIGGIIIGVFIVDISFYVYKRGEKNG